MIRTVTGNIDVKDVKWALAHEHLSMDLRHIRNDQESFLSNIKLQCEELDILNKQGFNLIVDMSNQSMMRNPLHLKKISQKTKLNIVAATGYYLHDYHSEEFKNLSVKEIQEEFIKDITIGINGTDIKAGVMGEIATSSERIFKSEKKVLLAAVGAQKETGAPIFTHVDHGNHVFEQINILKNAGADFSKTVIGHMDLVTNVDVLKQILETGVCIGFDTIGKNSLVDCDTRAANLIELIKSGYENQIVLSQDISRIQYLKKFGGHGYGYLVEIFYPKIKDYISQTVWNKLISKNITNILDF